MRAAGPNAKALSELHIPQRYFSEFYSSTGVLDKGFLVEPCEVAYLDEIRFIYGNAQLKDFWGNFKYLFSCAQVVFFDFRLFFAGSHKRCRVVYGESV